MASVSLSIVVPAHNEAVDLPQLLASLRPLIGEPGCELIVVDSGSTDATSELAAKAGARVIQIPRSPPGNGRNVGAQAASGRLLAFLDADVIVTPEWISRIQGLAANDGVQGVLTGDVYDVVENPSWLECCWFGAIYRRGADRYLNGGNLILRSEDFAKAGGFDAELISGEDVEFCERAALRGLSVRPDRRLRVLHAGYPSSSAAFIKRESWHGRGDFRTMRSLMRSPVAIAAVVFLFAHLLLLASVVMRRWDLAAAAAAAIVLCCAGSSWRKWRREPVHIRLMNALVFYLYFTGRSLAAVRELGARLTLR